MNTELSICWFVLTRSGVAECPQLLNGSCYFICSDTWNANERFVLFYLTDQLSLIAKQHFRWLPIICRSYPPALHNPSGIYDRDEFSSSTPFKVLIILSPYHLTPIGGHLSRQFATDSPSLSSYLCLVFHTNLSAIVTLCEVSWSDTIILIPSYLTFGNRLVSVRKLR